jgi:hypothetical protein
MSTPAALTHHEILALAAPLLRRGHAVDLPACDRLARQIAFKPMPRPQADPHAAPLQETLHLDCRREGRLVLLRRLQHPAGLQATLQLTGPQADVLLDALETVPPASQFEQSEGYLLARSYEVLDEAGVAARPLPLFMSLGQVLLPLLTLSLGLRMPGFRSVAGDLTLTPAAGLQLALPEDLLAVQGWDWARLVRRADGWTSKLRLRGKALRRSRTAEAALQQVARHLARVLSEPPMRYHQRHWLARWGVMLRRGIPTFTALGMIIGALLLPKVADTRYAGVWMALHYLPIALLAVSFSLQELPQFEIPRPPKRPREPGWALPPADPATAGQPGQPA